MFDAVPEDEHLDGLEMGDMRPDTLKTVSCDTAPAPTDRLEQGIELSEVLACAVEERVRLALAGGPQHDRALFDQRRYPNGDFDVVEASLGCGLSFDELVLVVWKKHDTVCHGEG